jgi:4-oxalocrotonate tautomerase
MPLVTIRVARRTIAITADQKARLISGVTDVVQAVLDKRRESVTVTIEELDPDNWGEGGETVTHRRAVAAKKPASAQVVRPRRRGG